MKTNGKIDMVIVDQKKKNGGVNVNKVKRRKSFSKKGLQVTNFVSQAWTPRLTSQPFKEVMPQ